MIASSVHEHAQHAAPCTNMIHKHLLNACSFPTKKLLSPLYKDSRFPSEPVRILRTTVAQQGLSLEPPSAHEFLGGIMPPNVVKRRGEAYQPDLALYLTQVYTIYIYIYIYIRFIFDMYVCVYVCMYVRTYVNIRCASVFFRCGFDCEQMSIL